MITDKDCEGKQHYLTRALANKIVKRNGKPLEPYKCKFCGTWHLGQSFGGKVPHKMKNWILRAFKSKENEK